MFCQGHEGWPAAPLLVAASITLQSLIYNSCQLGRGLRDVEEHNECRELGVQAAHLALEGIRCLQDRSHE